MNHLLCIASVLSCVAVAGCKDQAAPPSPATAPAGAAAVAVAPAAAPVAAPGAAPGPSSAVETPGAAQKLPLTVQGVAPAGLTVRVKGIEVGGDATVLDVSISFANRITDSTMLALADTYLEDESGARLHLKRPDNNRDLTLREGQTLDGQLVFLGRVGTAARRLKLVFNDGNPGDNIVAPGLVIELPLQAR